MSVEYLDVADFLAIAEVLQRRPSAVSTSTWTPPPGDADGEVSPRVIGDLAAGAGRDDEVAVLAAWIRERVDEEGS